MKKIVIRAGLVASMIVSAVACGGQSASPEETTGESSSELNGINTSHAYGQVLILHVAGSSTVRTALLLENDLALVANSVVPVGTRASALTFEQGVDPNHPTGTIIGAADILSHPDGNVSFVLLAQPFTVGNSTTSFHQAMDTSMRPNGTALNCYGYTQQRVSQYAQTQIGSSSGNTYTLNPVFSYNIDAVDAGIPCVDSSWNLIGVGSGTNRVLGATAFGPWLPIARQIFAIRATGERPFSLYSQPDPNNANVKKCLDIPWGWMHDNAPINQYDCHYQSNQSFYFDRRTDPSHPAIVSARSGKCIDIPNGILDANQSIGLQQYTCWGGRNQAWGTGLFNPQGNGLMYYSNQNLPDISTNPRFCITVSNGPNNTQNSVPVQIKPCRQGTTTNNDQRWFIHWN